MNMDLRSNLFYANNGNVIALLFLAFSNEFVVNLPSTEYKRLWCVHNEFIGISSATEDKIKCPKNWFDTYLNFIRIAANTLICGFISK